MAYVQDANDVCVKMVPDQPVPVEEPPRSLPVTWPPQPTLQRADNVDYREQSDVADRQASPTAGRLVGRKQHVIKDGPCASPEEHRQRPDQQAADDHIVENRQQEVGGQKQTQDRMPASKVFAPEVMATPDVIVVVDFFRNFGFLADTFVDVFEILRVGSGRIEFVNSIIIGRVLVRN